MRKATYSSKSKVNVKAVWLECAKLKNKPHLMLLALGVVAAVVLRRISTSAPFALLDALSFWTDRKSIQVQEARVSSDM